MTPALLESYRNARYELHLSSGTVALSVDRPCPELGDLLLSAGVSGAALLTAYNPSSVERTDAENLVAQEKLKLRLLRGGYRLTPATAIDPAGAWPPEPGFLVMGISFAEAMAAARDFQQLAFLWCNASAVPLLIDAGQASR
jgi:Protein of unknown function (DUF3293)